MSHVIVQRAISSHLSSNLHTEVDSAAEGAAASMEIILDTVALLKEEMVNLRRHSRLGVNFDHDVSFNSCIHTDSESAFTHS